MINGEGLPIAESHSETEKNLSIWTGNTSLEPVAAIVESDDDIVKVESEYAGFAYRDISIQDLKTEVSTFIQQLPIPLVVEEFKEEYITHGSWPIEELDLNKWGWLSYTVMIMEFAKTEHFEIVWALKVNKDCSQDRRIWCFALDPNNLEHWRYFFENGFVKSQKGNLFVSKDASNVQQSNKNSKPQPYVKTDSLDSSTQVEVALSRSSLPGLNCRQCNKRYGKDVCWAFQRQMCKNEMCLRPHRCSGCKSEDHGSEACPFIRGDMANVEPQIKKETLNNKKKTIVDDSLTSLELAQLLGAVDAIDDSNRSRKNGRSKGYCFRFQKGICVRNKCIFKHSCKRCDATDHGDFKCRKKRSQIKKMRRRKRKQRQNSKIRVRTKGSFHVAEVRRKSRKKSSSGTKSLAESAIMASSVTLKREVMPMYPEPDVRVPPDFSKNITPVMQKINTYDALPSMCSSGDYASTPLIGGSKGRPKRGRAVTRMHPY